MTHNSPKDKLRKLSRIELLSLARKHEKQVRKRLSENWRGRGLETISSVMLRTYIREVIEKEVIEEKKVKEEKEKEDVKSE